MSAHKTWVRTERKYALREIGKLKPIAVPRIKAARAYAYMTAAASICRCGKAPKTSQPVRGFSATPCTAKSATWAWKLAHHLRRSPSARSWPGSAGRRSLRSVDPLAERPKSERHGPDRRRPKHHLQAGGRGIHRGAPERLAERQARRPVASDTGNLRLSDHRRSAGTANRRQPCPARA